MLALQIAVLVEGAAIAYLLWAFFKVGDSLVPFAHQHDQLVERISELEKRLDERH
jgi:hypothetical protein